MTILDREFLEFLESRIVSIFKDKFSVVFEDLQSRPISETPGKRIFPKRGGKNVCETKIDSDRNEEAHRRCLVSDADVAEWAQKEGKGILYRCHQGKGFPNFLFPITIWPDEVIGYLYVGQFVFKRLEDSRRDAFKKQLEKFMERTKTDYKGADLNSFISALWSDVERKEFWNYIARGFPEKEFCDLIVNQIQEYGASPTEFFDLIHLVQGLANNLSNLGNSVYLLSSLVEIERGLPSLLQERYSKALSELREAIASATNPAKEEGVDVQAIVSTIREKSSAILLGCKNYEEEYIKELTSSFRRGIIELGEDVENAIFQFYARSTAFEAVQYSKLRAHTSSSAREIGDEALKSFLNVLASCGHQFEQSRELVKELFLKMYRQKDIKYLLEDRFTPCLLTLFDKPSDLQEWLDRNGVADLRVTGSKSIKSFSRTFDLVIEDLEYLQKKLNRANKSTSRKLAKNDRVQFIDLGDFRDYIRTLFDLRIRLSSELSKDRFGTRACLNQKTFKVFLNSGGLTSTHISTSHAQKEWMALRDEESPIGLNLEKKLEKKVEKTRELVAKYIGASANCIVFTNNTTSAIDFVLRGVLKPNDEIVTTDLEHNVVNYLAKHFKDRYNCSFTKVNISDKLLRGEEWLTDFSQKITQQTKLVIISHVFYSTGSLIPVKEVVDKCKEVSKKSGNKRIFVLVDGAQAVGNIKVNVSDLDCDFYAFDGHKWLLGPEGTGLLYCKEEHLEANISEENNPWGIHFPISTAFMASSDYLPRKEDGSKYELGTMDVSKFIGLGATMENALSLRLSETSRWRRALLKHFRKAIDASKWRIINIEDARKTGIVCLQAQGRERCQNYEKISRLLEASNIIVRCVDKPRCIRICLHHTNNETDVKIAAHYLNALHEGFEPHIGDHSIIKSKLKEIIKSFFQADKSEYVGLSIFSIPGAGKSHVVDSILREIKREKALSNSFRIRSSELMEKEKPEQEFAQIMERAKAERAAVIWIDEAEGLLSGEHAQILNIFNEQANIIRRAHKKVVFITCENNPTLISESAESRLQLAYFPLPDEKTRLKLLQKLARNVNCSSKLLLPQISRLTKRYSMRDLKNFWNSIVKESSGKVLTPEDFQEKYESFSPIGSDENFKKYREWINQKHPMIFTGQIETF